VGYRETEERRQTSMARRADARASIEEWTREDRGEEKRVREEIAELEELYAAPAATFEEVEEAEDEIAWFVVLIVFLLTLAATLAAAVVVFCWMKHGHLYAWWRLSALKVKIGCRR
jgi:hypothetical protein